MNWLTAFFVSALTVLSATASESTYPSDRPIADPCGIGLSGDVKYGYMVVTTGMNESVHGSAQGFMLSFDMSAPSVKSCSWQIFHRRSFANDATVTGEPHVYKQDFEDGAHRYGIHVFRLPLGTVRLLGAGTSSAVVVPAGQFVTAIPVTSRTDAFSVSAPISEGSIMYIGSVTRATRIRNPDSWFKIGETVVSIDSRRERDMPHVLSKFSELRSLALLEVPRERLPVGLFPIR